MAARILDNSTIDQLRNNNEIVAMLPELRKLKTPRGCRCRVSELAAAFDAVKTRVGNLGPAELTKLKAALRTQDLRVIYRDHAGKLQDRTV